MHIYARVTFPPFCKRGDPLKENDRFDELFVRGTVVRAADRFREIFFCENNGAPSTEERV